MASAKKNKVMKPTIKHKNNGRVAAFKRDKKTSHKGFNPIRTELVPPSKLEMPGTSTNSKRSESMLPEAKIRDFVKKHFRNGIYMEMADFAAENLCEANVEPASLFDANTGAVTDSGLDLIREAVAAAWPYYVDICQDTCPVQVFQLSEFLSDRTVLDFLMANAVKRLGRLKDGQRISRQQPPKKVLVERIVEDQTMKQLSTKAPRRPRTVLLEEAYQPDTAPRSKLLASKPVGDLQSQFWLAKGIVHYPDHEAGASWADHCSYYLLEAGSAELAAELAMRELCPAAYDDVGGDDAPGGWGVMGGAQDGPAIRAFYLGDASAAVDVGCGFAVAWTKSVTTVEYEVLKKWLS